MKTKIIIYVLWIIPLSICQNSSQWKVQYFSQIGTINSIDFSDSTHGAAVGFVGSSDGRFKDGSRRISGRLRSRNIVSNIEVFPEAIYTFDGGNWDYAILNFSAATIIKVRSVSPGVYLGTGEIDIGVDSIYGFIAKSSDSGKSWQNYGIMPPGVYVTSGLSFVNANTAYATSADSSLTFLKTSILKTTDGGLHWFRNNLPISACECDEVYFLNEDTGFTVGNLDDSTHIYGVIFKTTNGGSNWAYSSYSGVDHFSDIFFTNSQTGYASGINRDYSGALYETTNGGLTWFVINIGYANELIEGVKFVKGTGKGLFYGEQFPSGPLCFHLTSDYGTNWVSYQITELVSPDAYLSDSYFFNLQNWVLTCGAYTVGNGALLTTTDGGQPIGISPISNEIPKTFYLSQNFPNPFNPDTKIEYEIPKESMVQLIMFDLTGKEIAKLVNEVKQPGYYELNFDGTNYASGIYFYKLTAGDFISTKKMVLIK